MSHNISADQFNVFPRNSASLPYCPLIVISPDVVCPPSSSDKGNVSSLEYLDDMIHANFRTGSKTKFSPLCDTPGTNKLEILPRDFMTSVNDLQLLTYADYAQQEFRNDLDLHQFRIEESENTPSPTHRELFCPSSVTKMNQGTVRIGVHTVAMAVVTGNTIMPATKIHKSINPQHVERNRNGELVVYDLKAAWHLNINRLIAAIMALAGPLSNMRNFGAPSHDAFSAKCERCSLTCKI